VRKILGAAAVAAVMLGLFGASQANGQGVLLARGTLTESSAGLYADLSGLNNNLENGAPANLLGGLGSGFAWGFGNTFLALPDRGPNAVSYDSLVDDTVSYIPRFHTITMELEPNAGAGLPFTLTPKLESTTLLYSASPLVYGSGDAPWELARVRRSKTFHPGIIFPGNRITLTRIKIRATRKMPVWIRKESACRMTAAASLFAMSMARMFTNSCGQAGSESGRSDFPKTCSSPT